jgi:hypothetical protein
MTVYIDDRAYDALADVARVTGRSVTDLASAAVEEAAIAARRGGDAPGARQGHLPLTSFQKYDNREREPRTGYPIGDPRRG